MDIKIKEITSNLSNNLTSQFEWHISGYMDDDHVSFLYIDSGNNAQHDAEVISFSHTKTWEDVGYRKLIEDWICENESRLTDLKSGDIISLNPKIKEKETMEFEIKKISPRQHSRFTGRREWHVSGLLDGDTISFTYLDPKNNEKPDAMMTTFSHPVTAWDDSKKHKDAIKTIEKWLLNNPNILSKVKTKDKRVFSNETIEIKQHLDNSSVKRRQTVRSYIQNSRF